MVDAELFKEKLLETDEGIAFGITSYLLVSLFVLATIQFSALRQGQLPAIIIALVYGVFFIIMIIASRGNFIRNDSTLLSGPAAFSIGFILTSFVVAGFQFSFLSAPSESYLSSVLAQANPILVEIVNKFLAALENLLILSLPAAFYPFIVRAGIFDGQKLAQVSLASVVGIIPFAVLHGLGRSFGFLLMAAAIAYLWIMSVAYEDVLEGRQFRFFVPLAMFSIGSHMSFNSGGIPGLTEFWGNLISAASSGAIAPSAAYAIIIWQASMFLLFGLWLFNKAQEVL